MIVLCLPVPATAASELTVGIQSYLQQGKPDQAISTAQMLLQDDALSEHDRQDLLQLIVKAQMMVAKARYYEDVEAAVQAIETLIQEFPSDKDEPRLRWDIIELYWNQNNLEQAQSHILDLQNHFPLSHEAQESWLMLGKIHFIQQKYADARSALLRYAVHHSSNTTQGLQARMWTALVDYEEGRYPIAFQALQAVFSKQPKLITSQESIYARYIQLLDIQNKKAQALQQANLFLAKNKTTTHAAEIRLLRADLLRNLPNPNIQEVIKIYSILADNEAGTIIGRKAFMRKMMLQMAEKKAYKDIKPAIIALKRIANQNQMSEVEDEALLHEAQLWQKVATSDPEHAPKSAAKVALDLFAQAKKSNNQRIAKQAHQSGAQAFIQSLQALIKQEDWLAAIAMWEKFAEFRPPLKASDQLRFDIARGLRLLMQYDQAEQLLTQLQQQAKRSVWGEKVMLERARLWLDRGDTQGEQKVMQWLDTHEFTLYRPEMLLIVAQMQWQQGHTAAASHTLDLIQAEDIEPDTRAEFWKTKAQIAEDLSRWHLAAKAWRMVAKHSANHAAQAQLFEAHALFKGNAFQKAERLYSQTPQALQTPLWAYRYSLCQLKIGKWNQAIERLNALKDNPEGGIYTSMAALTLAEREANQLLEHTP